MFHQKTKGWIPMAQNQPFTPLASTEARDALPVVANVASPAPLGLNVLAFATAILGCFYAGFIIPFEAPAIRMGLSAVLLIAGIILVLAGMWEYRKNYMVTATIFTAYGGFLAILGMIFLPSFGILGVLTRSGELRPAMGLLFLCWTIFTGVLVLGAIRTNVSLTCTMIVLFAAYLLLTIGQLASATILLNIGGWLAIVTAIVAWLAAAASIVSTSSVKGAFQVPFGRRLAVVE
jgi:succinate-acetate transporter protein